MISLPDDECKHVKALRLREGESIFLSSGKGLAAEGRITFPGKKGVSVSITEFHDNPGEIERDVTLALGILSNKDRFEFALEKSVELGIKNFIPLITERCQKKTVKYERLQAKAIAALKQCKRGCLPEIKEAQNISDVLSSATSGTQFVLANEYGDNPRDFIFREKLILFVGPEGGFSEEERKLIENMNADKLALGNRRLRAETAALAGVSFACCY
jgi:16S rRNA (uracil1498-N3)-methyltransferase